MKKLLSMIFIMAMFVGCAPNNDGANEPSGVGADNAIGSGVDDEIDNEIVGTILDFFPFAENTTVRSSSDLLAGNQDIFTGHINNNRKQQRIVTHNIEMTAVLEYADGYLRQIFSFPHHYVFEDITDIASNTNIVILSEPLRLGHSWEAGDADGVSTITSVDSIVQTPMGEMEAIEVTTEFRNGDVERIYFARGIGIIKTDYTTTTQGNTIHVTTYLEEVISGGLEVNKILFFPDDMILDLDNEIRTVTIETNQDFIPLFEDTLRQAPEGRQAGLIDDNVNINSIELDRNNNLVTVDFSSNFIDNLGGGGHEELVLQALASTFGMFYRVENFRITLDGNNYESGHFEMGDDEFITWIDNEEISE